MSGREEESKRGEERRGRGIPGGISEEVRGEQGIE